MDLKSACFYLKENNMKDTPEAVRNLIDKGDLKAEGQFGDNLNIDESSLKKYVASFQKSMNQEKLWGLSKSSFLSL